VVVAEVGSEERDIRPLFSFLLGDGHSIHRWRPTSSAIDYRDANFFQLANPFGIGDLEFATAAVIVIPPSMNVNQLHCAHFRAAGGVT
jgi:hypothetical protein